MSVMNTTHSALHEVQKIMVREDLEVVLPATMLIRMVYEATEHACWVHPVPSEQDDTPDTILRSVLTYCYATGIFSSDDIETAASHNPVVRYLCANHLPQWQTIRDFRRRNMSGLKLAIGNMLYLAGRCFQRHDFSWQDDYSEADRLLGRAIQADSCALDV